MAAALEDAPVAPAFVRRADERPDDRIGERALSRLRWRCRRGLLENDLFVARFFDRHAATLTVEQACGLSAVMDLSDNDLLDLLLCRTEPQGALDTQEVHRVLPLLRHESFSAPESPRKEPA